MRKTVLRQSLRLLVLAGLVGAALAPRLYAELPPAAYEDMRKKAPVVANILVTRVTSALPPEAARATPEKAAQMGVSITVQARVLKVQRGQKLGATLAIDYEHPYRPPGFVGPGLIPRLEPGQIYTAYLNRDAATPGLFLPAAGARSFEPGKMTAP